MNHKLRSAIFSVNEIVKTLHGYSFASRADMHHMLHRCMKDLHELGFKISHVNGLKPKHIHQLVEHWKQQDKNPATIKNYLSKLRKLAVLIDKPDLVKPNNDDYQVARRSYAPKHNKAIHELNLSQCTDHHIRLSLQGQALFGLRREESMKFVLSEAWDGGQSVTIKPSWTKGGIGRTLPITNDSQRAWLREVSRFVQTGESLIPKDRTYKQHLSHYQAQAKKMDVCKLHGLRHAYAQQCYRELTRQFDPHGKGLIPPIAGSKPSKALKGYEKIMDRKAREILSRLLGHSRMAITRIYLG